MISSTVYIITTPTSSERLALLRSHLGAAPVELKEVPNAPFRLTLPWRVRPSYFDQFKKYLHVFEQIAKSTQPTLVLEDDALATPDWWSTLNTLPAVLEGFDFLFLSDDQFNHPRTQVAPGWEKCDWSRTTCATVYSPRAAALLLKRGHLCTCAMDWTINHLLKAQPQLKSFWHQPGLFLHGSNHGKFESLCSDG